MRSLGERDFSTKETINDLNCLYWLAHHSMQLIPDSLNGSHKIKTNSVHEELVKNDSLLDVPTVKSKLTSLLI